MPMMRMTPEQLAQAGRRVTREEDGSFSVRPITWDELLEALRIMYVESIKALLADERPPYSIQDTEFVLEVRLKELEHDKTPPCVLLSGGQPMAREKERDMVRSLLDYVQKHPKYKQPEKTK